jgi:hypothetical protein
LLERDLAQFSLAQKAQTKTRDAQEDEIKKDLEIRLLAKVIPDKGRKVGICRLPVHSQKGRPRVDTDTAVFTHLDPLNNSFIRLCCFLPNQPRKPRFAVENRDRFGKTTAISVGESPYQFANVAAY